MMNFSEDAVFTLHKIRNKEINKNVFHLLLDDEDIIGGYRTVRDQVIFTSKRIITIDVQGLTGKRQEFFTLPYKNIQYFGIQTVGFAELIPDAELSLYFSNGNEALFQFEGDCDILEIGQTISDYCL